MKNEQGISAALFAAAVVLVIPAAVAWSIFWTGITIHYLWLWFIFPVFNISTPGIVMCAGIATFVGILTKEYDPEKQKSRKPLNVFLYPMVQCIISLGFWWLVIKIAL